MDFLKHYQQIIIKALQDFYAGYEPQVETLYIPARYALEGGKKIRPVCTLVAAECFGSDIETALPAAMAVEMFHNFTLVHDDVMDRSPLRRGRPTVYHKWNVNQAILTGDAMLLLVYQILSNLPDDIIKPAVKLMTWAGLRVSEGQQLDMEFEQQESVGIDKYLEMIELKTAVLLGTAFEMGALVAKAPEEERKNIYNFGRNLGLAFQIQDDYLDLYADQEKFGKKIGNDIITRKKTFLLLKALELSDENTRQQLLATFYSQELNPREKISAVKQIYDKLNIKQITLQHIEHLYLESKTSLERIKTLSEQDKERLWQIASYLMRREK